ncbi:FAD-dependent oxidoreductase [Halopseudomonas nanhaiensis]|uniref:NAD(P)/FAD-dependent oxidoreductase n=1 Tax=Halopseudomonas nanhaiensis TaxID=2830842 RepID=UPI001CBD7594|nr:FAD-dependent oxidoreductase [Halopseudomonas nanhaiensis]UAW97913.1 FAD-dependent oxidoreductase [Halopseudomonas nanhaiensis]
MKSLRIGIIGAGLAGISAARALASRAHTVTLFDKSRGSGGRMSSKRTEAGELDMGAQYFTARDPRFRRELQRWLDAGWAAEWTPSLYRYDEQGLTASPDEQRRYVGVPRMTGLSRQLLEGLTFNSGVRITDLQRDDEALWHLQDEHDRRYGPFDRILLAVPAPQAVTLLHDAPSLAQAAAQVRVAPCWTLALSFAEPLAIDMDACFVRTGPLDWISRHLSKPQRFGADSWIIQSNAAWAAQHENADPAFVRETLTGAFAEVVDTPLPAPSQSLVHRWLYARSVSPCDWGALAAPDLGLYVCGDWCLSGRIEGAWLSGLQAADSVV